MPTVSEQRAREVVDFLIARYPEATVGSGPALKFEWDWFPHEDYWAIPWEEGPYDWAIEFSLDDEVIDRFPDLYLEPLTGWALGIYPA